MRRNSRRSPSTGASAEAANMSKNLLYSSPPNALGSNSTMSSSKSLSERAIAHVFIPVQNSFQDIRPSCLGSNSVQNSSSCRFWSCPAGIISRNRLIALSFATRWYSKALITFFSFPKEERFCASLMLACRRLELSCTATAPVGDVSWSSWLAAASTDPGCFASQACMYPWEGSALGFTSCFLYVRGANRLLEALVTVLTESA
mmetsp:Transcript_32243/g.62019  ORF Transcript_32243/g.62019 Transcript_32243/m.62019 type:complete len:203 (-) Transcript_32243:488-1096(-)